MSTAFLLKNEHRQPAGSRQADDRVGAREDPGRILVCAGCLHTITTASARIEVSGSHAHTFSNPHDFVFHIACFAAAPGCEAAGDPCTEFSWFPGCAWRVAVCRGCGEHLGWLFEGRDSRFQGLIVDRLAETEGSGSAA
jgi:hypothetical protein